MTEYKEYCDPFGMAEWQEQQPDWADAHPAKEWRDHRMLHEALAGARATLSRYHRSNYRTTARESVEKEFTALVTEWRDATENLSSLTKIVSHPAYQRIIDLGKRGEPVIPLILKDLQSNGGYWATALNAITGENPVITRHIGNPDKIKKDWIEWGNRRGYL